MSDEPIPYATLATLYQRATAAGLHFTRHGGGHWSFGPPEIVRKEEALVEELRRVRPQFTAWLEAHCAAGYQCVNIAWNARCTLRLTMPEVVAGIKRYKAWQRACRHHEREHSLRSRSNEEAY